MDFFTMSHRTGRDRLVSRCDTGPGFLVEPDSRNDTGLEYGRRAESDSETCRKEGDTGSCPGWIDTSTRVVSAGTGA